MDFRSWGQSPALQAFRNLPGDGVSCTSSPPVIHHPRPAGNCVSPRHLKTLRFYFPALVSFPVPENNSADFRNTHPRIVCIRQSVRLKAHTAQEWSDCLLERPAHLANDVHTTTTLQLSNSASKPWSGTFGRKMGVHSGTFGYIRVHSGTFAWWWVSQGPMKT